MKSTAKKQAYLFGIWAEFLTILFLSFKFYSIKKRRYRSYYGEIDLIAKKGKHIVFIEVKARKDSNHIFEVLNNNQQQRIKQSAEFFLSKNPNLRHLQPRFDFVAVQGVFKIKHIKNAW